MEEAQGGQSSKHQEMEKPDIGEARPSFPEKDVSKVLVSEASSKAALFDEEKQEEGEIREDEPLIAGWTKMSYVDEELEEGEIREDEPLMPGWTKMSYVDEELEEGEIREHEPLMPGWTKMSYVDEELEEGEIREGLSSEAGQNALEHHEASLEVLSSDKQEIGEAGVRVGQSSVPRNDGTEYFLHETSPDLTLLDDEVEKVEIRVSPVGHISSQQPNLVEQDETPVLEPLSAKLHQQIRSLKDEILKKQIDLIDEIYSIRLRTLLLKQNEELREFKTLKREQQMELVKMKNWEFHAIHICPSVRDYRIKLLNEEFSKRMDEFDKHMWGQRKKLIVLQIEARNKEKQMKDCWLEEAKAGILEESFYEIPLSSTGFKLEKFKLSKHYGAHDGSGNNKAVASSSSDLTTRPVESTELTDGSTHSASSCTNVVESWELSRPSPSILPLNQHGRAENMPLETEDQASNKINAVCTKFDEGGTDPGIAATASSKQDGGTGSSVVCLTDPTKQDKTVILSFAHALKSSEGTRTVLCNQVPSISEQERSAVPRVGGDQGSSSFPNNVASALSSVDTGFQKNDPTINVSTVPNPISLGLPLSVGLAAVMQGHGSSPASVGSACNRIHCSAQLTEVLMQPPVVATAAQLEQFDCISSQPRSPPVGLALAVNGHASRPSSVRSDQVPCNQVLCSAQPTEASMQQWLVLEESNHLSSQPLSPSIGLTSAVHGHPNTPAPAGSDLEPDRQIHCSAQLTEVSMPQPIVFTDAQWGNSNHLLSRPLVHPMPPTTDILPARTHTEFLRSTSGQPERGSHFALSCPITQSMPQLDPNIQIFHHEFKRLYALKALFVQRHEEKKLKLKLEYKKEIDNIKRKYDALIQDTDKEFVKRRKEIEMMYTKVSQHQELAGGFREIFNETFEEAGNAYQGARSSTGQWFVPVPQQQHFAQSPFMTSPSGSGPSPANLPPFRNLLPLSSVELRPPSSNVVPVPPVLARHSTPTVFSSNAVRSPPSSMAHSIYDLNIRSTPHGLAHLLTSTTSMSLSNLQQENGSRLNQQQVFNDMGISLSASEQILPVSGSHQPEGLGMLHVPQSQSPSTSDFLLRLAGSLIGVKRANQDS